MFCSYFKTWCNGSFFPSKTIYARIFRYLFCRHKSVESSYPPILDGFKALIRSKNTKSRITPKQRKRARALTTRLVKEKYQKIIQHQQNVAATTIVVAARKYLNRQQLKHKSARIIQRAFKHLRFLRSLKRHIKLLKCQQNIISLQSAFRSYLISKKYKSYFAAIRRAAAAKKDFESCHQSVLYNPTDFPNRLQPYFHTYFTIVQDDFHRFTFTRKYKGVRYLNKRTFENTYNKFNLVKNKYPPIFIPVTVKTGMVHITPGYYKIVFSEGKLVRVTPFLGDWEGQCLIHVVPTTTMNQLVPIPQAVPHNPQISETIPKPQLGTTRFSPTVSEFIPRMSFGDIMKYELQDREKETAVLVGPSSGDIADLINLGPDELSPEDLFQPPARESVTTNDENPLPNFDYLSDSVIDTTLCPCGGSFPRKVHIIDGIRYCGFCTTKIKADKNKEKQIQIAREQGLGLNPNKCTCWRRDYKLCARHQHIASDPCRCSTNKK